jgi:hypothetical protein
VIAVLVAVLAVCLLVLTAALATAIVNISRH